MLESRRKRYLSGPDWVIATLDRMLKETTCSGNMSQIVLLLNAPLDGELVRNRLSGFSARFPVLQGKVSRDILLSPYWKIPAAVRRDVTVTVTPVGDLSTMEALIPLLTKTANSSFRDDGDHLAFHLFTGTDRCALAMTFDHRILDARGAESFLQAFQQHLDGDEVSGDISFSSSSELTEWRRKFLAGRSVNRRIIALSRSTPRALPLQADRNKGFRYRLLSFDRDETTAIYDRAYREAGYLMESPFFLAAIIRTMHDLFGERLGDGSSYLIPVTTDLRTGKAQQQELFFNHVSYLFYQIPVTEGMAMAELMTAFKQQMYDQVKSGFPRDLAEASLLTRIAPLGLLGKLIHLPLKGKMATFVFSHLGKSSYRFPEFMGAGIENIFHMPRVPVPPGLGFFSNTCDGRLNLVISYLDGLFRDDDLERLAAGIRENLGSAAP
jgi:hypothetical protein